MTRVLLVGDVHLRDTPAANNTPAALEDVWHCLEHIATISSEFDAVIFSGDLFDHKNPAKTSHALVLRAIKVFGSMHNAWCIAGNHDLSSDRIESLSAKQPLGVLIASGAIKILSGWMETAPVFGLSWLQDWMNPTVVTLALQEWIDGLHAGRVPTTDLPALLVTHAPLFPPGAEPPYEALDQESLADAMGHHGSVYFGHIHDFHGVWDAHGIKFANAGSINRYRLTQSDMTRAPTVTTWDSTTGHFEFLPIPDTATTTDIFRIDEATATRAKARDLDQFLAQVQHSTIDISSTQGLIAHLRTMDAPPAVIDRAISLVEQQDGT